MNEPLKFHCDFGTGTNCTITLDLEEYRKDPKNIRPKTVWVGPRTDEVFELYRPWMHTVNAAISEAIQSDHVYVLQDWAKNPRWEFWVYHPSGERECVAEGDGVFHPSMMGR
jgi:hypothetical protein